MKKCAWGIIISLLCINFAFSQTTQGRFEVSVLEDFNYLSFKEKGSDQEEIHRLYTLAFRPGYYLIDNLSVETEFLVHSAKAFEPAFNVTGHLSYAFDLPNQKMKPFISLGAGLGNGVQGYPRLVFKTTEGWDVNILAAGTGVKYFISDNVAFRSEYRFERYTGKADPKYLTEADKDFFKNKDYEYELNKHNLMFGVSVLLP